MCVLDTVPDLLYGQDKVVSVVRLMTGHGTLLYLCIRAGTVQI